MWDLARYEGKNIKITTGDGAVFTGAAEVFPSGYGLAEFGRAEESLRMGEAQIFLSEIRSLELCPEEPVSPTDPRRFDDLMGRLLEGPYWIADILPAQVPRDAPGQYFAVDRYFRQEVRLRALRRRYAELLLRLNCYYDMTVSFDSCESWEENPDPEAFADRVERLSGNDFLRVLFPAREAMIDLEPDDTWMTVYDPRGRLTERLRPLAAAEGLFLWAPPQDN